MSTAVADPRAERLANLWSRLSAQHVTLGAGCGCMTGGVSVSLEDFELDIADYLWAESERLGEAAVVAFVLQPGPVDQQVKPVMQPCWPGWKTVRQTRPWPTGCSAAWHARWTRSPSCTVPPVS